MDTPKEINRQNAPTLEEFGLDEFVYENLKNNKIFLIAERDKLKPPVWLLVALALLLPFSITLIFTKASFLGGFGVAISIGLYVFLFLSEATEFLANVFSGGKYKRIEKEIEELDRSTREMVSEFEKSFHDYFQEKLDNFYATRLYKKRSGTSAFDESLGEFGLLLDELSRANNVLLTKRFSLREYQDYLLKRTWNHSFQKSKVDSKEISQVSNFVKKTTQTQIKPRIVSPEEKYRTPRKINWDSINKNRQKTGLKGEEIAVEVEKDYLRSVGESELAEKVCHMAKEYGDGFGYDVLSYFPDGKEKYIEVKSTTGSIDSQYYISKNELGFLTNHQSDAFIYRIQLSHETEDLQLVIRKCEDVFNECELVPVQYAVKTKQA